MTGVLFAFFVTACFVLGVATLGVDIWVLRQLYVQVLAHSVWGCVYWLFWAVVLNAFGWGVLSNVGGRE